MGISPPQEFVATERLLVFVRLTLPQLRALVEATDCVFELDLAPPDVRGWLLVNDEAYPLINLEGAQLDLPSENAPSVVLLDTGIAAEHPLLREAIRGAYSVAPGDASAADVAGHGTGMAGIALFDDVGEVAERNAAVVTHWLESVKILSRDGIGPADEAKRQYWPATTQAAFLAAEDSGERRRVFTLATSAPLEEPRGPTTWSHAIDQLAYNDGQGRLVLVAVGNVDPINKAHCDGYPDLNLTHYLDDPAHAGNALSIGAFTRKTSLPPDPAWQHFRAVAPEGAVAPCTRAGIPGAAGPGIKPDVVFEGGNLAADRWAVYSDATTLQDVTTGREVLTRPLVGMRETSAATAHAARFAARLWAAWPEYRPETIRGLIVHSADWTSAMRTQLPSLDDRLALCGLGVPSFDFASHCIESRATVVLEDSIASAVWDESDPDEPKNRRTVKFFRLPVPEEELLFAGEVELRVTLSYLPEPNTFGRRQYRALDLAWDMQGPSEPVEDFERRINKLERDKTPSYKRSTSSYDWEVGIQRRSRGTVQSDRWTGPGALLAGARLLAVYPVLGWWEKRGLEYQPMPFSLIVSISAPGLDIYTPISTALLAEVRAAEIEIE